MGVGLSIAIASVIRTAPEPVVNSVSSTIEPGRYRRSTFRTSTFSAGASFQRPFSGEPSSAAKHAPESNRGTHSQSIEPSRPTRAAVRQSPIIA